LKQTNVGFAENVTIMAKKNEKLQKQVDQLINDLEKIRDQEESLRNDDFKLEKIEKNLEESKSRENHLRRLNVELTQRLKLFKV